MDYRKKSVENIDVAGKRVLVRCDFNVPRDVDGNILDTARITSSLPTIRLLLDKGASVILCSHLGRPKGKADPSLSLVRVRNLLEKYLDMPIPLAEDIVGPQAKEMAAALKPGQVMMLENLRFMPYEEKNDPEFSKALASLADQYVNDAFGAAHRAHSSTAGVADYLPAACGLLIKKEITIMGEAMQNPQRPFTAVLGGAKISDKLKLIESLLSKADNILICGGMSYTFIKAMGGNIGKSICDDSLLGLVKNVMEEAKKRGVNLLLPEDVVVCTEKRSGLPVITVSPYAVPEGFEGFDIGPRTARKYAKIIRHSATVIWNGPCGVFEIPEFSNGTWQIANAIADCDGVTIAGGGDSAAAINEWELDRRLTHVSTGGGASLEFLEGRELPGIACLDDEE